MAVAAIEAAVGVQVFTVVEVVADLHTKVDAVREVKAVAEVVAVVEVGSCMFSKATGPVSQDSYYHFSTASAVATRTYSF